jgi:hypothetical protein
MERPGGQGANLDKKAAVFEDCGVARSIRTELPGAFSL